MYPRPAARVVVPAPLACALMGTGMLAGLGDLREHAVAAACLMVGWGIVVARLAPAVRSPAGVVLAALLVRGALLFADPSLSDDVWRYVWEGEVWRAGWNPFAHAPDDPALAALRDATWARVNHRSVPSVYPPLAQALFVVLSPGGPFAWRLISAAADVVTCLMLARRAPDPRAGWWWALLPLPAVESAVSGHLEGLGVALLVGALTRPARSRSAGALAWLGAMTKLLPGVLLLREPRGRAILWAGLTLAVCLPVVRPDGFAIYGSTWSFDGSIFPLAERVLGHLARPVLQLAGAGIVAVILTRTRDPRRLALWTTGAFVALSPTVHPWYVLWPFAASLCAGTGAWLVLAVTVPASYVVLSTWDPATGAWTEWVATRWAVYLPFYAALFLEAWRRLTRAGP